MSVIIHQVKAVLDMPDEYLAQVQRAKEVIAASSTSTYVTVPAVNIDAAKKALDTFENAQTSAEHIAAFRPLVQSLQAIMFWFQQAANADAANAVVIIESGAFKVGKYTPRQKQAFKADFGVASGTIVLEAEGAGPHACHDWMYSADGLNFVHLAPTTSAHKLVTGLTVGQYAYFTHEVVIKDEGQGVSQVEKILVK